MAWDHLSITKPHLVYIILGGFTSLFMLCSSFIKERMYIGEATVATLCGLIFGPHAANLIDPKSWGNVDIVTIEFSRIVLVVQCFAVGVELPKFYMERHWKSVVFLLVPVMVFGWLITSLFVWWMIPPLNWLESLVIAACVTATDPVLASSVVGKGKFAKRVPKHLRDLLSAESGCNDGMAFPFIYLSLYLIQDHQSASKVSFHWIVYTILYECIFGAVYGFLIGYIARHGIKLAERHDLIDRESFLVFYFVLALFCAGSGSILGVDDLLVGFSAGVGFSNDGWFGHKTEESHVSNVIDLLLNLTYFVYLGTVIPWEMFNDTSIGLSAWRLTIIAIFVILFRRIPVMMALKPLIPDIKTWREALFAGHFGPIGVGAVFVAILARAELESDNPVPLAELPEPGAEHYTLLTLVWPIVTFLVVASIIVHGSSIAVFTLGKRINTLTLTLSYTTAPEDGPSWMSRLPRISSQSRSQARTMSDTEDEKAPAPPPGALLPIGIPGQFLRRMKSEDASSRPGSRASSRVGRRRRKKWDDGIGPGGPISQSAIYPKRRAPEASSSAVAAAGGGGEPSGADEPDEPSQSSGSGQATVVAEDSSRPGEEGKDESAAAAAAAPQKEETAEGRGRAEQGPSSPGRAQHMNVYDEGDNIIIENEAGDVLAVEPTPTHRSPRPDLESGGLSADTLKERLASEASKTEAAGSAWTYGGLKKRIEEWKNEELQKRKDRQKDVHRHEPARAYQFGNTIIVEDEDGEVLRKYELPPQEGGATDVMEKSLKYMGMGALVKPSDKAKEEQGGGPSRSSGAGVGGSGGDAIAPVGRSSTMANWITFNRGAAGEASGQRPRKKSVAEVQQDDDRHIRFTIGGVGQRMTKEGFIQQMQKLDQGTRREVIATSTASGATRTLARQDAPSGSGTGSHRSPKPGMATAESSASPRSRPQQQHKKTRRARGDADDSDGDDDNDSSSDLELPSRSSRGRGRAGSSAAAAAAAAAATTSSAVASGSGTQDVDDDGYEPETAVERRRRLAVLETVRDDDDDDDDGGDSDDSDDDADGNDDEEARETPAERRRREAALGMSGPAAAEDSDDDDTPRVPPVRRGIRFADAPSRR